MLNAVVKLRFSQNVVLYYCYYHAYAYAPTPKECFISLRPRIKRLGTNSAKRCKRGVGAEFNFTSQFIILTRTTTLSL